MMPTDPKVRSAREVVLAKVHLYSPAPVPLASREMDSSEQYLMG
jgi:hypothetical protein